MSALEQIKNGIESGDLNIVAQGYRSLTGTWIQPPNENENPLLDELKKGVVALYDLIIEGTPSVRYQEVQVKDVPPEVMPDPRPEVTPQASADKEASPSDPFEQFRTKPKARLNEKGEREAVSLEFQAPKGPNQFSPDAYSGTHADLVEGDKKLAATIKRRAPKRPPIKKVKMECGQCHNVFEVNPVDVPGKIAGESPMWRCDRCLSRPKAQ